MIGINIGERLGPGRIPPQYAQRPLAVQRESLLGYWQQAEPSGTAIIDSSGNGRNGVYSAVTLNQPGIGDGTPAALYNGTTSYGNIHSAGLAAAFNPLRGSAGLWLLPPGPGMWTDGIGRYLLNMRADASNRISLRRSAANNTLIFEYLAGGVTKNVTPGGLSGTDWIHMGLTWDRAADRAFAYLNGVQQNLSGLSGLGTWAGALSATGTLLGANQTTNIQGWSGCLAHLALWSAVLSADEMAYVGRYA